MKLIIPMAGWGTRLRPHTVKVPKPMIKVAGKSIVERLIMNIDEMLEEPLEEIAFIIREDFGPEIEKEVLEIGHKYTSNPSIYYQKEALGTGHAILMAKNSLSGPVIVGFADTMFQADFQIDPSSDAIIWVKQIPNPEAFGVIKLNDKNEITEFVEKPKTFVSDLAIIGIYYFKDGKHLSEELQYLIDNDIRDKGEYQLTSAMENMRRKGDKMTPGKVNLWLDCGNKDATVASNQEILKLSEKNATVDSTLKTENAVVIPPCYIAENVIIKNSVVGPYVSLGENSVVNNSTITNCLIQNDAHIENKVIADSMIGQKVTITGIPDNLSLGDYSHTIN